MTELGQDLKELLGSAVTGYTRTSPEEPTLAGVSAKAAITGALAGMARPAYRMLSEKGHNKSAVVSTISLGAATVASTVILRGEIRDFAAVRRS